MGSWKRSFEVFGVLAILAGIVPSMAFGSGLAERTANPMGTASQNTSISPEQHLVERYAPIIGLKDQQEACDEDGEPFYPVSVDMVLGKDDVVLKRDTGSASSSDEVVMPAPTAADLYAKGDGYYLDLPGNPRRAGCDYEQWFDANKDGYDPMTYAHIVANGLDKLVVQYWFYYVFNNFNNTHESDWEMMQIAFDVGTVDEALQSEPVSTVLAQHGGGETAGWTDNKLQKDGDRPIVFAASGSHATQYGNAVYLGWGENGTGFGCDITTAPSTLVPLNVTLLPDTEPDPASDLAWLNFAGRWGERQEGEFNGPTGPAMKKQWKSPFLWQSEQRDSSLNAPIARTFGPAPTSVFCNLSAAGSNLVRIVGDKPALFLSIVLTVVAVTISAMRYVWPTVKAGIRVYKSQWKTFMLIGLWLVPVGILFSGLLYLVTRFPPGSTVVEVIGKTPGTYYALALLALILQLLASLIVVGPMTINVFDAIQTGDPISFREAWQRTRRRLPGLARSVGLVALTVVLLSVTVVGAPVAIWLLVRWIFVSQTTVLDDAGARESLRNSSRSVEGRWWRVAMVVISLSVVAIIPGALVGLGLLMFGSTSVQITNLVSSLLYVVGVPLSLLGLTLVYRNRELTPPPFQLIRRLTGKFRNSPPEATMAPTR